MLTLHDIITNLEPIPPDLDNRAEAETWKKKNCQVSRYGACTTWIPSGTVLHFKNKKSSAEDNRDIIKAMQSIFKSKKCMLSEDSQNLPSMGTLWAPGCSDKGAIVIQQSHKVGLSLDYIDQFRQRARRARRLIGGEEYC
jgi:hypothetical protein